MTLTRLVAPESGYSYGDPTELLVISCAHCGIRFGMPTDYDDRRRNDHRDFYCPNGHQQGYHGKSATEQERDRLKRQLGYAEAGRQAAADQAQIAERRRRAEKGHRTRLQRKIAAGECPCCHEKFLELQAHLAEAHPDFPPAEVE